MEELEILGYLGGVFIGISLGLIGGGGSILAVPTLAYLFNIDEKIATAYSLFIVGISALIGGIKQHMKGYVDWKMAIIFGIPAILGVSGVRTFIVPYLPEILFEFKQFAFTRRMGMFGLFAILMIPAAFSMLKNKKEHEKKNVTRLNYPIIFLEGFVVGSLTGFVGAGGGFLIIPALVVLTGMEMKKAVSTSLIIIAFKSILGFFIGDAVNGIIDWQFLFTFTSLSLIGILIGSYIGNFVDGKKLKRGFGYFIIIMAFFIFYMEFFFQA